MIDPQPLSRDISHHELRSAYGRLTQDSALLHDMFSGKADIGGVEASCIQPTSTIGSVDGRLEATDREKDVAARLEEVWADIERAKAVLDQRKQSILAGRSR